MWTSHHSTWHVQFCVWQSLFSPRFCQIHLFETCKHKIQMLWNQNFTLRSLKSLYIIFVQCILPATVVVVEPATTCTHVPANTLTRNWHQTPVCIYLHLYKLTWNSLCYKLTQKGAFRRYLKSMYTTTTYSRQVKRDTAYRFSGIKLRHLSSSYDILTRMFLV